MLPNPPQHGQPRSLQCSSVMCTVASDRWSGRGAGHGQPPYLPHECPAGPSLLSCGRGGGIVRRGGVWAVCVCVWRTAGPSLLSCGRGGGIVRRGRCVSYRHNQSTTSILPRSHQSHRASHRGPAFPLLTPPHQVGCRGGAMHHEATMQSRLNPNRST